MTEKRYFFPSLDIDPALFFTGTEDEINAFLRMEEERQRKIYSIITAPGFRAAELKKCNGAREILHFSTREGVLYQLSYIAPDGVPTMHENYISTGGNPEKLGAIHTTKELLYHFSAYCNRNDITLRVLYQ